MSNTTQQIQSALTEAQASAVMITESGFINCPEYIAAITAIAHSQSSPSPANELKAEGESMAFLVANFDYAMASISKRIASRSAANPTSDAANRALSGQD